MQMAKWSFPLGPLSSPVRSTLSLPYIDLSVKCYVHLSDDLIVLYFSGIIGESGNLGDSTGNTLLKMKRSVRKQERQYQICSYLFLFLQEWAGKLPPLVLSSRLISAIPTNTHKKIYSCPLKNFAV